MLVALIDGRGARPPADIVEPPALQWKAGRSEVLDRRGEIDAAGEPRLDGMLVAGGDVFEMSGLQGADMAGDDLLGEVGRARRDHQQRERRSARGAEPETRT